jgi:hypothetical protein
MLEGAVSNRDAGQTNHGHYGTARLLVIIFGMLTTI